MYMDRIATEIEVEVSGIEKLVIYANDLAVCGNINAKKLIKILEKYKFKVNPEKSCSFLKWQAGESLVEKYTNILDQIWMTEDSYMEKQNWPNL